ncbi:Tc toxin subunit A-related protein [Sinosporangium siamense]|nr:hemopexin repeat-containing protein [Sinosporangium siamense]
MSAGSSPDYARLFGEIRFPEADDARSVYSPAAYFVELLGLLEGTFDQLELLRRRPDLTEFLLDEKNTFTEIAYLDVVNEVLERLIGNAPYDTLRNDTHPFGLPFSLHSERLRVCLEELKVTPEELYRLFAARVDHDVAAREYLELSAEDVEVVTGSSTDPAVLKERYGLAGDEDLKALLVTRRFNEATGLDHPRLRELVALGGQLNDVTLKVDDESALIPAGGAADLPPRWLDRAHRLIRLARKTGLSLTDLDLVLTSYAGGLLDKSALRAVAGVVRLGRVSGVEIKDVCELVVEWKPDEEVKVEFGSGDILTPANRDYRFRLAAVIGVAEPDIVEIVRRYRERYSASDPSPFDRGTIAMPEISLLRRVGLLASALGVGAGELFDVLVALEGDPGLQRYTTFAVLGEAGPETRDLHKVLEGGDSAAVSTLWLVQTLFAVVGWMRTAGFEGSELAEILGGRPDPDPGELKALFDRLSDELDPVALSPRTLVSDRFGERAAEVIHDVLVAFDEGVVASVGSRLLEVERAKAEAAAHRAVTDLGVIFPSDLTGLGLGDRLQGKIFRNLVYRGRLRADGTLTAATSEDLAGDFTPYGEALFTAISATVNGTAAYYPSDLETLAVEGLTPQLRAELYDNLLYNGHIDEEGELRDPGFFLDPRNAPGFTVNVDLADAVKPVAGLIQERLDRFREEALKLDEAALAGLRFTGAQLARLLESLRFNGHIDAAGRYTDQARLLTLDPADFGLAAEFAVVRIAVLSALRGQIAAFHTELTTFDAEDLAEVADELAAARAFAALDGVELADGRVIDPSRFAGPEGAVSLGPQFSATDEQLVFGRLVEVLKDEAPYRLEPAALTTLGLTDAQRAALFAHLVETGALDERQSVPAAKLGYFANADNSLAFELPGMIDYSRDVFFLLHDVAKELTAAVEEVVDRLVALAGRQDETLYACLADVLGLDQDTARALCVSVAGGERQARVLLAAPALDLPELPDDPRLRLAHRRIRRFALLAAKLGLDAVEVRVVFADQDLVGKFPEPLTLPPGVTRIQALLDAGDGTILLFGDDGGYWAYSAVTRALTSPARLPLTELSPNLAALTTVDAAFVRPGGVAWLVGRDAGGSPLAYTREPGGTRWGRKTQAWGKVKNAFADPARIDSAFTDLDGRTYLFAGDQYVRYSGTYDTVDEGYPRDVDEWRTFEGLPLPAVRETVDACFQDLDGVVHVFTGDRSITAGGERPAAEVWGLTGSAFAELKGLDAAYTEPSAVRLILGGEALRYSDSVENPGVVADEGVPRRLQGVPPQFESGVEAAFTDPSGVVHLFKDGKTVALDGTGTILPTAERWGRLLRPPLGAHVDAAFAGLDGRTYVFSGQTYLRYSTSDYSVADPGYPRLIPGDWGGLDRVRASFVMDGCTYLFGDGGMLFELPVAHQADLDAGRITPALRVLFQEHGLTLTGITGGAVPRWDLTTAERVALVVERRGLRLKVYGRGSRFYVRYSTRDYRTPDQGFPKPLSDNWWNMPEGIQFEQVDAVFTGRDQRTYLFAGDRFVRFDARHRWWSEPMALREKWDSIPFSRIDAAFVGVDGRTYLFSGGQYVRYSTDDYTEVDDGYPAAVNNLWGHVANNLARTGKVDAAFVLRVTEKVDGVDQEFTRTYLVSGDQFARYTGDRPEAADPGYPRRISALAGEPGLGALSVTLDGVDAAFTDRRTLYLVRGGQCHAVSTTPERRYDNLPLQGLSCAYLENGSIVAETGAGWQRLSALEGTTVAATPFLPRTLRTVPAGFASGLSSVLTGADGTTYLFKGTNCFNTEVGHAYPIADEWGRPRDVLRETGAVDAAFVGRDGRTYLFSGDQFVVHDVGQALAEGDPRPIAEHWGGLESVGLAYVHRDKTHLYGRPDAEGRVRHVVYSGTSYAAPDGGYPVTVEAASVFPGAPDGFAVPDAVLVEGTALVLLAGKRCVSYDDRAGHWSIVRPIDRLYPGFGQGLDAPDKLRSALRAADGATWFFFGDTCVDFRDGAFGTRGPVRDHWGGSPNPFLAADGTVDAAFVWRGEHTYLFSGDRYVRYTGRVYDHIDPGYPKLTAGNLRKEEPFAKFPESFEDALGRPVDAIVGNDRTIHVIIEGVCHTASPAQAATFALSSLGRMRNTLAETGRVDAALVYQGKLYLFSGDQYVRYSGRDRARVDDGYPRALGDLAAELNIPQLPPGFQNGLDAAFCGSDGVVRLFKGRQVLCGGTLDEIRGKWGLVRNGLEAGRLDAAFTAPSGELYVFSGDQYVRYPADGVLEYVESGYPRTVKDDWGDIPSDFEAGPDGAFVLDGRTYLLKGDRYIRYSGPYHVVDRTFPQDFLHRWSGTADYRLNDVHTIVRFTELCRTQPDGLAAFFLDGAEDPYAYLAETFGRDLDEVRWARRNMGLLRADTREENLFEIEFLLTLVDLFTAAGKIGSDLPELHGVWAKAFGAAPDLDGAATALHAVLERRTAAQEWRAVSDRLRDRLNVLKRDALVARLTPQHGSSRDLYEQYYIDVDMGGEGRASRVREAIAATQLYLQRYLLGLESVTLPAGSGPEEEVRARLRKWWSWMRSYRTWEVNRKVFLYPENYLRPDLRTRQTPAFAALKDDLLQGDITDATVQAAYKRYLDEYTEVSRLAIAGGYVWNPDGAAPGVRRLVLFGRTRTEPRRYYYRSAEFRDGGKLSATWDPWLKVDVQIDADRVHPVHAFGRVFVFWSVVEPVPKEDPSKSTVVVKDGADGRQDVSTPPPLFRVKIYYSFLNLNGEWVPAQVLDAKIEETDPDVKAAQIADPDANKELEGLIFGVDLAVQASRHVPDVGGGEHDSVVVQCSYVAITFPSAGRWDLSFVKSALSLTPEMYGLTATTTVAPAQPADLERVFAEPPETAIREGQVVRFNAPADYQDGRWFSVDHKGGSFLCRPIADEGAAEPPLPYAGNQDQLPTTWSQVDAAFRLGDGTLYFFDAGAGQYIAVPPGKAAPNQNRKPTGTRFGIIDTSLWRTGVVDAGVVRGGRLYLFAGADYYRYQATVPLGDLDPGYPKKIRGNADGLPPRWDRVDVAFTIPNGVEVFYERASNGFVTSADLLTRQSAESKWKVPSNVGVQRVHQSGGDVFVVFGDKYVRLAADLTTASQPLALAGNRDGVPEQAKPGPELRIGSTLLSFDNTRGTYTLNGLNERFATRDLGRVPTEFGRSGAVTASYIVDGKLFLVGPREYVRYTLPDDRTTIPECIDAGYPKPVRRAIRGVFPRGNLLYAFTPSGYARVPRNWEPDADLTLLPYEGNWRGVPDGFPGRFNGLFESDTKLFFFLGPKYARYPLGDTVSRPYEIATLPIQVIRLTSSTASELNRRLLAGGLDALLDPSTQELDELPAFSTTVSNATTVRVRPELGSYIPVSAHLDFESSNGLYYWELFFHAPLLIAQALNGAQRFEEARRWYEYVFDPGLLTRYWRFLPFLAADVDALIAGCRQDLTDLGPNPVQPELEPILAALATLAPAFRHVRELTKPELDYLDLLADTGLDEVRRKLATMPPGAGVAGLGERVELIGQLRRQYNLMGDGKALLQAYLDDPNHPHTIAALRPEAYRRAVVMGYIDNLLDWGDMLFQLYTSETVDEARMLYIYAYDLLGPRPVMLGPATLPPAAPYTPAGNATGAEDVAHLTAGGKMIDGDIVHSGIANPYFFVPGNPELLDYWTRVEDRLTKIRASLDFLGISRPLPLFDPPLDVMALVRGAASGGTADALAAAAGGPVPAYRFDFVYQRARELTDRLQQLGSQLLDVIDRRDSEELTRLQNRQDGEILALTTLIKETEVKIAEESLAELRDARTAAENRVAYYQKLIDDGMSPLQEAQLAMMAMGAAAQFVSAGLRIGSGVAAGFPQALLGPFIMGSEVGGEQVSKALEAAAEVSSSFGEGFSGIGEVLGVRAEQERQEQDWEFQRDTCRADVVQIGHQVTSAELQVVTARRELEIHKRQIAHQAAVADFLTSKFTGPELYGWMVGQVSGIYFQTYRMALDMARAAERAYEAERGKAPGVIRGTYWDSRRKGLLAGEQLGFDLDRLNQAYFDSGSRGMEITKKVSLLHLDAPALLALKNDGRCEFALTETLFDRDFPGHYQRRIKTVSVAFITADGPVTANATLTQIDNKTVLSPDPKAVRYLLDPKGLPPANLRGDWRPGQRIALSEVEEGREDSGVFDLRYDDPRYLPFEGTGAVSRWRLETRRPPAGLLDVVIIVRYTASDGGDTFATAVRGMLKPYPSALFLDVAAQFPDAWDAFAESGTELELPITPALFPSMSGRQVTGVVAQYGTAGGNARFLLNGDARLALTAGRLVQTPGLTAGGRPWRFTAAGDPSALAGFTLILLYRAIP